MVGLQLDLIFALCSRSKLKYIFPTISVLLLLVWGEIFLTDTHFAPQNTLLLGILCRLILCFSEHFDPQHILIPGTLCFLKQFAPQHILLAGTLCSLEYFALWNILLLCKMFSPTYFALWNTKSKVFQETKCSMKQSVLRRKVFLGAKCAEE